MEVEAMRLPLLGRLRLRWPLLAALIALLVVLLVTFAPAPSGPLVTGLVVNIPATSKLSAAEVREAAAPAVHGGVLDVNLAAVQARVETLPWVKQASVRRLWPNTLAITVVPERPVARWGDDALVDASGHIFTPPSLQGFDKLPILHGADSGNTMALFDDFHRANVALSAIGLQVKAFSRNPRGEVAVTLAGGTRIELGSDNARAMLTRFVTVAAPALGTALGHAATVDMRYPNGFAVGWKRDEQHG